MNTVFGLIGNFLSPHDAVVCSLTVSAVVMGAGLLVFSAVQLAIAPAAFSLAAYGGAAAAILGSFGTVKTIRDRFSPCDQPQQQTTDVEVSVATAPGIDHTRRH